MSDKQPTKEQIQKFWEWCGFHFQTLDELKPKYRHPANLRWVYPDGDTGGLPAIDLNNLFKYAVPKLDSVTAVILKRVVEKRWNVVLNFYDLSPLSSIHLDPALAFFWATG